MDYYKALVDNGYSQEDAKRKALMFEQASKLLPQSQQGQARAFVIPGRVEVAGKHTDYCGGQSLLCAVSRGMCMLVVPRKDTTVRLYSTKFSDPVEVDLKDMGSSSPPAIRRGHWSNYPLTALKRLSSNFEQLVGFDAALASDLPKAAGMSSSSAVICAMYLAVDAANSISSRPKFRQQLPTPEDLYEYLGCVENGQTKGGLEGNRGVGTFGGSEDHTAIMACQRGQLVVYSYCPTKKIQDVQFPKNLAFCIGVSGVEAEKTGQAMQKYNHQASRAQRAARALGVKRLADAWTGREFQNQQLQQILAKLNDKDLKQRTEQFVRENYAVVPGIANAFAKMDRKALGALATLSQEQAEQRLGNQIEETSAMVKMAKEQGAIAASAFGAGFGGSVWALVETSKATQFAKQWKEAYLKRFQENQSRCEFFITTPMQGAKRLAS